MLAELAFNLPPFTQVLRYAGLVLLIGVIFGGVLVASTGRPSQPGRHRHWLSQVIYAAFLVAIGVLAVSSFGSLVQFGHMANYALLVHVAAAGGFVFLLLAIALLYLPIGDPLDRTTAPNDTRWWLGRWSAWALVLSGIAAAGTMFLSMLPILDTQELIEVAEMHRYAGLAVTLAAVTHLFALICTRIGLR
ncbi:hypothetical protein [Aureliella helgolandensis]|uniref:Cytochrome b561 bacterial/Ni-hydrogenase domain-containing protein n=1 Tax=Aureliella helgolandensis TaxID=2527968 RepID=A0A518G3H6_9BACT|nr:hypothetical protein [Aureliella helgolandensis]QDV23135.1 hypothetical protein Q31a_14310 [Aureliella helgolandensis]